MSTAHSPSPPTSRGNSTAINRQTTTPFLLNLCYKHSAFHSLSDFPLPSPSNPHPPLPAHLQVYTWPSCTLRELTHIIHGAVPDLFPTPAIGTRIGFRLVFPDSKPPLSMGRGMRDREGRLDDDARERGRYTFRDVGSVVVEAPVDEDGHTNGNGADATTTWNLVGGEADKTLADARFVIGDYVDCAVFPPLSDGSVVPRTAGGVIRGGAGPPPVSSSNGYYGRPRGGAYGGGGLGPRGYSGAGAARGDFGTIPSGEWRRGERVPEGPGGYRGGYGRGGGGGGGGRRY